MRPAADPPCRVPRGWRAIAPLLLMLAAAPLARGQEPFSPAARGDRVLRDLPAPGNDLYAIGYAGAGNLGNETAIYRDLRHYKVDAGVGIEAGASYRKYRAFLGALVAKTLVNGVGGFRLLFSLKSYR